jgi:hypothetical protein
MNQREKLITWNPAKNRGNKKEARPFGSGNFRRVARRNSIISAQKPTRRERVQYEEG